MAQWNELRWDLWLVPSSKGMAVHRVLVDQGIWGGAEHNTINVLVKTFPFEPVDSAAHGKAFHISSPGSRSPTESDTLPARQVECRRKVTLTGVCSTHKLP